MQVKLSLGLKVGGLTVKKSFRMGIRMKLLKIGQKGGIYFQREYLKDKITTTIKLT